MTKMPFHGWSAASRGRVERGRRGRRLGGGAAGEVMGASVGRRGVSGAPGGSVAPRYHGGSTADA